MRSRTVLASCIAVMALFVSVGSAGATSPIVITSHNASGPASPTPIIIGSDCPGGTSVSGGGVKVSDLGGTGLHGMYPVGGTFDASVSLYNDDLNATTFAICIANTFGSVSLHQASTTLGDHEIKTIGAGCGGENLLGGGVEATSGSNSVFIHGSYPNETHDGWEARVENDDPSGNMTVYALCSPDIGPAKFKHKEVTLKPEKTGGATAKCPQGTKLVGGGGAFEGFIGDTYPTKKDGSPAWKSRVNNASSEPNTISADAICLKP